MSVASATLTARARLIDAGRSLGLSEALVEDAHGRVVAHATSRYFVLSVDPVPERPDIPPIEPLLYDTPDPYLRPLTQPLLPAEIWRQESGLDILLSVLKGERPRPPCAVLFGAGSGDAEEGRVTQTWPASEWFCSPARTIHGGVIAFFLDVVLTGAVATTLPPGAICAPLDLKVNFLRPGIADGRDLTATGLIVHRGRTLAVARGDIANADGKVLATATSSMRIAEGRSWGSLVPVDEPEAAPE